MRHSLNVHKPDVWFLPFTKKRHHSNVRIKRGIFLEFNWRIVKKCYESFTYCCPLSRNLEICEAIQVNLVVVARSLQQQTNKKNCSFYNGRLYQKRSALTVDKSKILSKSMKYWPRENCAYNNTCSVDKIQVQSFTRWIWALLNFLLSTVYAKRLWYNPSQASKPQFVYNRFRVVTRKIIGEGMNIDILALCSTNCF